MLSHSVQFEKIEHIRSIWMIQVCFPNSLGKPLRKLLELPWFNPPKPLRKLFSDLMGKRILKTTFSCWIASTYSWPLIPQLTINAAKVIFKAAVIFHVKNSTIIVNIRFDFFILDFLSFRYPSRQKKNFVLIKVHRL